MEQRNISGLIRNINAETRTATFEASNENKDRHGTVLNADGWRLTNFHANPIIGYQHNVYGNDMCDKATPDDIIGKGSARIEKSTLITDVTFKPEGRSELADKVFEDVRDGFLNTVSVGFIPVGKGKLVNDESQKEVENYGASVPVGHTFYFEGQELLEISVVNIPSNPTALKKSFRDSTARALTYLVKAFGGTYSLSDIDKMTVGNILKLLNNDQLELQYDAQSDDARNQDKADRKEIEKLLKEEKYQDEKTIMELQMSELN